jgi:hypothetical protein
MNKILLLIVALLVSCSIEFDRSSVVYKERLPSTDVDDCKYTVRNFGFISKPYSIVAPCDCWNVDDTLSKWYHLAKNNNIEVYKSTHNTQMDETA